MGVSAVFLREEENFVVIAMDDYPPSRLGYAMDKLSIDSKYFRFPNDRNPRQMWEWRYRRNILPAIKKLLKANQIPFMVQ